MASDGSERSSVAAVPTTVGPHSAAEGEMITTGATNLQSRQDTANQGAAAGATAGAAAEAAAGAEGGAAGEAARAEVARHSLLISGRETELMQHQMWQPTDCPIFCGQQVGQRQQCMSHRKQPQALQQRRRTGLQRFWHNQNRDEHGHETQKDQQKECLQQRISAQQRQLVDKKHPEAQQQQRGKEPVEPWMRLARLMSSAGVLRSTRSRRSGGSSSSRSIPIVTFGGGRWKSYSDYFADKSKKTQRQLQTAAVVASLPQQRGVHQPTLEQKQQQLLQRQQCQEVQRQEPDRNRLLFLSEQCLSDTTWEQAHYLNSRETANVTGTPNSRRRPLFTITEELPSYYIPGLHKKPALVSSVTKGGPAISVSTRSTSASAADFPSLGSTDASAAAVTPASAADAKSRRQKLQSQLHDVSQQRCTVAESGDFPLAATITVVTAQTGGFLKDTSVPDIAGGDAAVTSNSLPIAVGGSSSRLSPLPVSSGHGSETEGLVGNSAAVGVEGRAADLGVAAAPSFAAAAAAVAATPLATLAQIFKGCVFYIDGETRALDDLSLKQLLIRCGGQLSAIMGRGCTHVIAQRIALGNQRWRKLKDRDGRARKYVVVTSEWVFASIAEGRRLPISSAAIFQPAELANASRRYASNPLSHYYPRRTDAYGAGNTSKGRNFSVSRSHTSSSYTSGDSRKPSRISALTALCKESSSNSGTTHSNRSGSCDVLDPCDHVISDDSCSEHNHRGTSNNISSNSSNSNSNISSSNSSHSTSSSSSSSSGSSTDCIGDMNLTKRSGASCTGNTWSRYTTELARYSCCKSSTSARPPVEGDVMNVGLHDLGHVGVECPVAPADALLIRSSSSRSNLCPVCSSSTQMYISNTASSGNCRFCGGNRGNWSNPNTASSCSTSCFVSALEGRRDSDESEVLETSSSRSSGEVVLVAYKPGVEGGDDLKRAAGGEEGLIRSSTARLLCKSTGSTRVSGTAVSVEQKQDCALLTENRATVAEHSKEICTFGGHSGDVSSSTLKNVSGSQGAAHCSSQSSSVSDACFLSHSDNVKIRDDGTRVGIKDRSNGDTSGKSSSSPLIGTSRSSSSATSDNSSSSSLCGNSNSRSSPARSSTRSSSSPTGSSRRSSSCNSSSGSVPTGSSNNSSSSNGSNISRRPSDTSDSSSSRFSLNDDSCSSYIGASRSGSSGLIGDSTSSRPSSMSLLWENGISGAAGADAVAGAFGRPCPSASLEAAPRRSPLPSPQRRAVVMTAQGAPNSVLVRAAALVSAEPLGPPAAEAQAAAAEAQAATAAARTAAATVSIPTPVGAVTATTLTSASAGSPDAGKPAGATFFAIAVETTSSAGAAGTAPSVVAAETAPSAMTAAIAPSEVAAETAPSAVAAATAPSAMAAGPAQLMKGELRSGTPQASDRGRYATLDASAQAVPSEAVSGASAAAGGAAAAVAAAQGPPASATTAAPPAATAGAVSRAGDAGPQHLRDRTSSPPAVFDLTGGLTASSAPDLAAESPACVATERAAPVTCVAGSVSDEPEAAITAESTDALTTGDAKAHSTARKGFLLASKAFRGTEAGADSFAAAANEATHSMQSPLPATEASLTHAWFPAERTMSAGSNKFSAAVARRRETSLIPQKTTRGPVSSAAATAAAEDRALHAAVEKPDAVPFQCSESAAARAFQFLEADAAKWMVAKTPAGSEPAAAPESISAASFRQASISEVKALTPFSTASETTGPVTDALTGGEPAVLAPVATPSADAAPAASSAFRVASETGLLTVSGQAACPSGSVAVCEGLAPYSLTPEVQRRQPATAPTAESATEQQRAYAGGRGAREPMPSAAGEQPQHVDMIARRNTISNRRPVEATDKSFVASFFEHSRLHFIGRWRIRCMQTLSSILAAEQQQMRRPQTPSLSPPAVKECQRTCNVADIYGEYRQHRQQQEEQQPPGQVPQQQSGQWRPEQQAQKVHEQTEAFSGVQVSSCDLQLLPHSPGSDLQEAPAQTSVSSTGISLSAAGAALLKDTENSPSVFSGAFASAAAHSAMDCRTHDSAAAGKSESLSAFSPVDIVCSEHYSLEDPDANVGRLLPVLLPLACTPPVNTDVATTAEIAAAELAAAAVRTCNNSSRTTLPLLSYSGVLRSAAATPSHQRRGHVIQQRKTPILCSSSGGSESEGSRHSACSSLSKESSLFRSKGNSSKCTKEEERRRLGLRGGRSDEEKDNEKTTSIYARRKGADGQRQHCHRDKKRLAAKKWILHVDFDAFFVAVAIKKHPELAHLPVAVAHSRGRGDGVATRAGGENSPFNSSGSRGAWGGGGGSTSEVASCNYAARAYGVYKGQWLGEAKRCCPSLRVLSYDFEGIAAASRGLFENVLRISRRILPVSCDETYLQIVLLPRSKSCRRNSPSTVADDKMPSGSQGSGGVGWKTSEDNSCSNSSSNSSGTSSSSSTSSSSTSSGTSSGTSSSSTSSGTSSSSTSISSDSKSSSNGNSSSGSVSGSTIGSTASSGTGSTSRSRKRGSSSGAFRMETGEVTCTNSSRRTANRDGKGPSDIFETHQGEDRYGAEAQQQDQKEEMHLQQQVLLLCVQLRTSIYMRTGCWVSIGAGPNLLLAKLAGQRAKPKATVTAGRGALPEQQQPLQQQQFGPPRLLQQLREVDAVRHVNLTHSSAAGTASCSEWGGSPSISSYGSGCDNRERVRNNGGLLEAEGVCVLGLGEETARNFVAALPLQQLPGVGPVLGARVSKCLLSKPLDFSVRSTASRARGRGSVSARSVSGGKAVKTPTMDDFGDTRIRFSGSGSSSDSSNNSESNSDTYEHEKKNKNSSVLVCGDISMRGGWQQRLEALQRLLGRKRGAMLWWLCFGKDPRPLPPFTPPLAAQASNVSSPVIGSADAAPAAANAPALANVYPGRCPLSGAAAAVGTYSHICASDTAAPSTAAATAPATSASIAASLVSPAAPGACDAKRTKQFLAPQENRESHIATQPLQLTQKLVAQSAEQSSQQYPHINDSYAVEQLSGAAALDGGGTAEGTGTKSSVPCGVMNATGAPEAVSPSFLEDTSGPAISATPAGENVLLREEAVQAAATAGVVSLLSGAPAPSLADASAATAPEAATETTKGALPAGRCLTISVNWGIRLSTEDDVLLLLEQLAAESEKRLHLHGAVAPRVGLRIYYRRKGEPIVPAKFLGTGICDTVTGHRHCGDPTPSAAVAESDCPHSPGALAAAAAAVSGTPPLSDASHGDTTTAAASTTAVSAVHKNIGGAGGAAAVGSSSGARDVSSGAAFFSAAFTAAADRKGEGGGAAGSRTAPGASAVAPPGLLVAKSKQELLRELVLVWWYQIRGQCPIADYRGFNVLLQNLRSEEEQQRLLTEERVKQQRLQQQRQLLRQFLFQHSAASSPSLSASHSGASTVSARSAAAGVAAAASHSPTFSSASSSFGGSAAAASAKAARSGMYTSVKPNANAAIRADRAAAASAGGTITAASGGSRATVANAGADAKLTSASAAVAVATAGASASGGATEWFSLAFTTDACEAGGGSEVELVVVEDSSQGTTSPSQRHFHEVCSSTLPPAATASWPDITEISCSRSYSSNNVTTRDGQNMVYFSNNIGSSNTDTISRDSRKRNTSSKESSSTINVGSSGKGGTDRDSDNNDGSRDDIHIYREGEKTYAAADTATTTSEESITESSFLAVHLQKMELEVVTGSRAGDGTTHAQSSRSCWTPAVAAKEPCTSSSSSYIWVGAGIGSVGNSSTHEGTIKILSNSGSSNSSSSSGNGRSSSAADDIGSMSTAYISAASGEPSREQQRAGTPLRARGSGHNEGKAFEEDVSPTLRLHSSSSSRESGSSKSRASSSKSQMDSVESRSRAGLGPLAISPAIQHRHRASFLLSELPRTPSPPTVFPRRRTCATAAGGTASVLTGEVVTATDTDTATLTPDTGVARFPGVNSGRSALETPATTAAAGTVAWSRGSSMSWSRYRRGNTKTPSVKRNTASRTNRRNTTSRIKRRNTPQLHLKQQLLLPFSPLQQQALRKQQQQALQQQQYEMQRQKPCKGQQVGAYEQREVLAVTDSDGDRAVPHAENPAPLQAPAQLRRQQQEVQNAVCGSNTNNHVSISTSDAAPLCKSSSSAHSSSRRNSRNCRNHSSTPHKRKLFREVVALLDESSEDGIAEVVATRSSVISSSSSSQKKKRRRGKVSHRHRSCSSRTVSINGSEEDSRSYDSADSEDAAAAAAESPVRSSSTSDTLQEPAVAGHQQPHHEEACAADASVTTAVRDHETSLLSLCLLQGNSSLKQLLTRLLDALTWDQEIRLVQQQQRLQEQSGAYRGEMVGSSTSRLMSPATSVIVSLQLSQCVSDIIRVALLAGAAAVETAASERMGQQLIPTAQGEAEGAHWCSRQCNCRERSTGSLNNASTCKSSSSGSSSRSNSTTSRNNYTFSGRSCVSRRACSHWGGAACVNSTTDVCCHGHHNAVSGSNACTKGDDDLVDSSANNASSAICCGSEDICVAGQFGDAEQRAFVRGFARHNAAVWRRLLLQPRRQRTGTPVAEADDEEDSDVRVVACRGVALEESGGFTEKATRGGTGLAGNLAYPAEKEVVVHAGCCEKDALLLLERLLARCMLRRLRDKQEAALLLRNAAVAAARDIETLLHQAACGGATSAEIMPYYAHRLLLWLADYNGLLGKKSGMDISPGTQLDAASATTGEAHRASVSVGSIAKRAVRAAGAQTDSCTSASKAKEANTVAGAAVATAGGSDATTTGSGAALRIDDKSKNTGADAAVAVSARRASRGIDSATGMPETGPGNSSAAQAHLRKEWEDSSREVAGRGELIGEVALTPAVALGPATSPECKKPVWEKKKLLRTLSARKRRLLQRLLLSRAKGLAVAALRVAGAVALSASPAALKFVR